jgi:thiosulfate/3-mercaptopyruvate sulfurtransferase
MANSLSPLINPRDIVFGSDLVVVDARSGPDALERYSATHLEEALHADLDRDLAKKPLNPAFGGRHPLPDVVDFTAFLGQLGIGPDSRVIVYDDKGGANAAARFWWMLRALGHPYVRVVDGGWDAIVREGLPTTAAISHPKGLTPYPADSWQWPTVAVETVKQATADADRLIIDVRESYRFRGESEPIDLIAGHIPGAINIPYLENLTPEGYFLTAEALAKKYHAAIGQRDPGQVIVHCGSGVTACHTLLALEQAGISGTSLYVGSWGEWSRRDLPIETER